jgi:hypothetical protein
VSKADAEKSRFVKWMTIGFGSVPILGLVASMPLNYHNFGTPFTVHGEWNNLFLWESTYFCWPIYVAISGRNDSYGCVILYALICSFLYALVGFVLGLALRGLYLLFSCNSKFK